jgi:parallel beta-helix repeat protein
MLFKKKGWGKFVAIALFFTFLFQCVSFIVPETASAATTKLTITKYAIDRTTVIDQVTVDYDWLMDSDNIPVLGDGTTRYYHQGPVFIDEPADYPVELERLRWNEEEDRNWDTKDMGAVKGNNLKDLCNLVGGMVESDEVQIKATDGFNKKFAYKNVYNYDPDREGPMVVCWYKDGLYPDTGYTDGMRLVWFAAASSKVGPTDVAGLPSGDYHVFGNWEWREAADPEYWYYYSGIYPTTTGLSVQNVASINIYSNETVLTPPDLTADTEDNQIGQAVDITFTDDEDWRTAISRIRVNGREIDGENYSLSPGKISIVADVFDQAGEYNIAVIAEGYSMVTVTQSMASGAVADFTADKTSGPAPLTVQFADKSTENPTSWAWDFDNDGVVDSIEQNPSYEYTAVGTYTVKLTVSNDLGSDEEIKEDYITVTDPAPKTWYVDDSGGADFSQIQDAVTAAKAGDTIIVKDGTYTENITVDKSLVIRSENGAGQTLVQAAATNLDVFKVTTENVTIDGFTISGSTSKTGILLTRVTGQPSGNCTVTNNLCTNNNEGISILSSNNTIDNNTCTLSGSYGINLNNTTSNTVTGNTCSNINGSYAYAIYLADNADNNTVSGNTADSNSMGIRVKAADNNTITANTLSNNTVGIELATKPVGNVFYLNNFINNGTQVNEGFNGNTENSWNSSTVISYTYKGTQYNNQLGNYWSNYTGADIDGDGIGDTPYTTIASYMDNYPLMGSWQDGVITPPPVAVSGVSISEGNQELEIGQTIQLTAVVEPEDATNKNVSWSSSEEAIATVSETGLVTAVGEGTASITVTTEDGNFTDSITINSLPVEPQISLYCNSGIPGASVFMAGRGFDAEVAGTIWFDTNDDGILDQDESSIAVVTDQHGAIPLLTSISVPSVDTGDYSIRADIGDSKVSVTFNVTDTGIIVSPISGNGQAVDPRYITVTGTGLPASASYRLFVDRNGNGIFDDGAYKSGTTAADSTLNINNLSWPSSPAGIYNILLDIGKDDTIEAAASVGVVPGLKITTPRGVPGTNIGMTLVGFSANADGYVWFDTNGNEVWDEDENKAAVTTTTAGGASSPGLYVPSAPPGLYQVLADIPACGLKANSVTYSIAGLVLNPDSGIVGSSIDVTGYGLVTNQTGKYIWFDSNDDGTWNEDEPKVDVSTDASCTISPVSITVPEVPAGTYNVRTTVAPNTMFAVFTVNAPPSIPVTGVSITEGDQELEIGQTVQLTAVVEPGDANNKNVSWSSSDEGLLVYCRRFAY